MGATVSKPAASGLYYKFLVQITGNGFLDNSLVQQAQKYVLKDRVNSLPYPRFRSSSARFLSRLLVNALKA